MIEAPILAYLIETTQGRVLYDVGCDYSKIADPDKRGKWYDPAVFAFAAEKQPAYDPGKISGFAFGMGVERIAMMKYGISEIGQFYSGDMRFLEQFV